MIRRSDRRCSNEIAISWRFSPLTKDTTPPNFVNIFGLRPSDQRSSIANFRRLIEHTMRGSTTKCTVNEPSSSQFSRRSSSDSARHFERDPGLVNSVNWFSKLPSSISVQRSATETGEISALNKPPSVKQSGSIIIEQYMINYTVSSIAWLRLLHSHLNRDLSSWPWIRGRR